MSQGATLRRMVAALTLVVAASIAVLGQVTLTLGFTDLEPHIGQALSLRVVDTATMGEVARVIIPSVVSGVFQIDVAPFTEGHSYQVDYFVDQNANGIYDVPPGDAAWRFYISSIVGPGFVDVPHNEAYTDIGWPPLVDGAVSPGEYRHSLSESRTGITLCWQNDATVLYIALAARGTGWLGIGLDPTSRMEGANYILGAVTDGALSVTDEFGVSAVTHRADEQRNILQAAGQEADGVTVIEFAIPLASGDAEDKALVPGQTVTALLALNSSDDSFSARHTARAAVDITLDTGN